MARRRYRSGAVKFSLFAFQDIITCVMGIMLLLTLMLCLQIVQNPGIEDVLHDSQAFDELTAARKKLQASLVDLEAVVQTNDQLFSAGGLLDEDILQSQLQKAASANERSERDLRELEIQAAKAKDITQKLKSFDHTNPTRAETEQVQISLSEAQRVLEELEQGKRILYNRPAGSNECWVVEISSESHIRAAVIGKKQIPVDFPSIEHCRDWMIRRKASIDFMVVIKPETWNLKGPLEQVFQDEQMTYVFDLLPQSQYALDDQHGAGY